MNKEVIVKSELAGRSEFIDGVESLFPESFAELHNLEDELLHLDMASFARTTVSAIESGNVNLFKAHFNFISELFSKAHPDLENAIYVSYLENVLLDQSNPKVLNARELLPDNLKIALSGLEEHFEKLHESSKNT